MPPSNKMSVINYLQEDTDPEAAHMFLRGRQQARGFDKEIYLPSSSLVVFSSCYGVGVCTSLEGTCASMLFVLGRYVLYFFVSMFTF